MSGAKKASLRLRATYRSSLFLRSAICLIEGALPRQSSRHMLSIGIDVRVVPIRHSQAEHKQDRTAHYPPTEACQIAEQLSRETLAARS